MTPWEINLKDVQYDQVLDNLIEDNFFLQTMLCSLPKLMDIGWQTELTRIGTATVIAIHLFKSKNGYLPENLKHIVEYDYLEEVPFDPYSGSPIIYRKIDDGFILYSVNRDMKDNGGNRNNDLDFLFWPLEKPER